MKYALTTVIVAGQAAIVETYGDRVWEGVCDALSRHTTFSLAQAIETVRASELGHLSARTARDVVRVVLHNVVAEYADRNDAPLARIGSHGWQLT